MKNKAIIFDLDGTLIDSLEDIAKCMNKALEKYKQTTYEIEDYKHFVGSGVDILVENALKKGTNEEIKTGVIEEFKKIYDENLHGSTKPYAGIYDLLDELKKLNFKIGVLSNKPHEFTLLYVDKLFSKYNFDSIYGQRKEVPKKPHEKGALIIAEEFNINCEEIYFVGDTKVDMQTAKNANMKAIGVLWGFRDKKELEENKADYIVQNPLDILDIVK